MKKPPAKDQKLVDLECEFYPLLVCCLQEFADGRWGLFGQNDDKDGAKYLRREEGARLKEIALEIRSLRAEFGRPNPHVERFLHYCSMSGANVPGEPKLAKTLLEELKRSDFESS
jgi:hypothetical protein